VAERVVGSFVDGSSSRLGRRPIWDLLADSAKTVVGFACLFRPTYPDFLHGAPPTSACAAFIKEIRMKFVNANQFHRKSGVRLGERGAPVPYQFVLLDSLMVLFLV